MWDLVFGDNQEYYKYLKKRTSHAPNSRKISTFDEATAGEIKNKEE